MPSRGGDARANSKPWPFDRSSLRFAFTAEQRQRLAIRGKALTPDERQGCCQLVQPATIVKWFRELVAKPYDGSKQQTPGRPRKPNELRELVLRLANENVGWGYTKIRDALRGMKIEIGLRLPPGDGDRHGEDAFGTRFDIAGASRPRIVHHL